MVNQWLDNVWKCFNLTIELVLNRFYIFNSYSLWTNGYTDLVVFDDICALGLFSSFEILKKLYQQYMLYKKTLVLTVSGSISIQREKKESE